MRHFLSFLILCTPARLQTSDEASFGGNGNAADIEVSSNVTSFAPDSPDQEVIAGDPEAPSANDYTRFYANLANKDEKVKAVLDEEQQKNEEWQIWAVDKVPKLWPVVLAVIPPGLDWTNRGPPNFQDADSHNYTWHFEVDEAELPNACTNWLGEMFADPCQGKVVNRWFNKAGTVNVSVDILTPSGETITAKSTIEVLEKFPDTPVTRRYEVRDMPQDIWVKFVKAMYALKASRVYDHLTQIHAKSFEMSVAPGYRARSAGHGGPAFLVFHRIFIRLVEIALQKASGDPTLGQPYWDWTIDAENGDGLESEIFTSKWYGPGGDIDAGGHLTSGVFCGVPTESEQACTGSWYIPESFGLGTTVRRQLGRDGGLPTKEEIERIMNLEVYDDLPFSTDPSENPGFRVALEGWQKGDFGQAHNGIHSWVGGTMYDVFYAPADPIFMAHHSMVDKLFTEWQQSKSCFEECYQPQQIDPRITPDTCKGAVPLEQTPEGEIFHLLGNHISDTINPWGIRVYEVFAPPERWTVGSVTFMEPKSEYIRDAPSNGGTNGNGGTGNPAANLTLPTSLLITIALLFAAS